MHLAAFLSIYIYRTIRRPARRAMNSWANIATTIAPAAGHIMNKFGTVKSKKLRKKPKPKLPAATMITDRR